MKKIFLIIVLLMLAKTSFGQFATAYEAWRVVFVSPNYPNIYPRYSNLQQTFNAIKDSANATTGKLFIVNVVTNADNISDWTSQWMDSLVNRQPYVKLTSFGQAVNDSIIGVTDEEFTLVAGILSLNALTAGTGLTFNNHQYSVNVKHPVVIANDSVTIQLNDSNFVTNTGTSRTQYVTIKRAPSSGINYNENGLYLRFREPLSLSSTSEGVTTLDTIQLKFVYPLTTRNDSLYIDFNESQFTADGGDWAIALDSGLKTNTDGIGVWLGSPRLSYLSNKSITIPDAVAGDGLIWSDNTLKLLLAQFTDNDINTSSILKMKGDSLQFNFYQVHFTSDGNGLLLNLDSGLTEADGVQLLIDHPEIQFNASKQLQTAPTLWGGGLYKSGDSGSVRVNEFAKVENDTVKIKTSYVVAVYGDSLTSNVTLTGAGVLPFDTTGTVVLAKGKIKRVTWTYQLTSSGNDTVVTSSENTEVNFGDKIRVGWNNGGSRAVIQKWSVATRTWSTVIQPDFAGFGDAPFRIMIELYAESQ